MNTIYALIDPFTHEARYVGLTNQPLALRLKGHLNSYSKKIAAWVEDLDGKGAIPEIIELETEPIRDKAAQAELFWLHYLSGMGARLLNTFMYRKESRPPTVVYLTPMMVDHVNQAATDRSLTVGQLLVHAIRALEEKEAARDRELAAK